MPGWVQHAMWWHVYPLGFVGAEPQALPDGAPPAHRFEHLTAWLDHVVDLGLSGVALGPVFASHTHGYDTVDHRRIDPRLGTEEDFDAFVAAARSRGLRVTLDGVFNHVGRGFDAFAETLRHGPGAPRESWFRLTWPDGAGPGSEPDYADFEGHHALVALNHDEPAVARYVTDVMTHWLDRGVDGWRLDAAYAVPPAFWQRVLPAVRERHPDAYVFGEVLHGDLGAVVTAAGFDAVTQYELWKAVWSSLNDGNFFELLWALTRHDTFLDTFVPLTFLGNHDVTRLASRLTDRRHVVHAVALLLTLGGTPTVYAGDELGMTGVKEDRAGGDDAVRPTFPPSPAGAALEPGAREVLDRHRELIALRRRHPWLHTARTESVACTNRTLVLRQHAGDDALLLALSVEDSPTTLPAPGATSVLAGDARVEGAGVDTRVVLPPHGWAVLAV
ncbi:alpha-amylase family glycosyl hydrolase [Cellulomonas sp. ATA003]|uniref:alpha-amylase family glycosyl hydrolase n=1 Tax=Cellulomonas sp. ATA003 TaxID=3073064 RepID=UPI002872E82B|nr:alpha-amylase family glycosyl hydrolase [Cellulomonas sp. ATA003]WNB86914.1 alpha-amylase family glycosyl hydrolase [Cellulomonas sp. ATA003]